MQLGASRFPDVDAIRRGEGTIRLHPAATFPRLSVGSHQLLFRNRHHPDRSVYLANALVPESDQVAVTAQRRDGDQRDLTIDYVVRAAPATSLSRGCWAASCSQRQRRLIGATEATITIRPVKSFATARPQSEVIRQQPGHRATRKHTDNHSKHNALSVFFQCSSVLFCGFLDSVLFCGFLLRADFHLHIVQGRLRLAGVVFQLDLVLLLVEVNLVATAIFP